ncbi:Putative GNAT domain, acyl-CoA N-acyltransferase, glucosamine 6-phosphate N-acetyltransferase [Septoria linicola]|uniref:Glucosamine 6-phosphate N-acetyltransferase n=1 Tax=Septoria linicola TaxID=215465 RepID=A0A9Q9AQL0_9PEZI|nr:putative GNAT domain, acyl-CoA N-acyltransferase, glucosamine 6-phosphate N-acetyltransferase [Septoria linicola]USW50277.1 Putative GNAT domain, acyl-CoA N-acyltransferase, glucosamine 6-phosphate N-acetyltransferase [Septoria linicola]
MSLTLPYIPQSSDSDELFSPSLIDQSVQDSLEPGYTLRPLNRNDYHKGYFENLKALTWVGDITHDQYLEHFDWMRTKGEGWFYNVVIEHEGRIVGNGVLIVERKFIWGLGRVGHIEEICIHKDYQKQGLGKAVVKALDFIAVKEGVQRSILDCGFQKTEYYMKCGYKCVGIQMARSWEEEKQG